MSSLPGWLRSVHRRVSDVYKDGVIKGIGKSRGKRQSPKGSKTRVCLLGGYGSDKNAVLISKFEVF